MVKFANTKNGSCEDHSQKRFICPNKPFNRRPGTWRWWKPPLGSQRLWGQKCNREIERGEPQPFLLLSVDSETDIHCMIAEFTLPETGKPRLISSAIHRYIGKILPLVNLVIPDSHWVNEYQRGIGNYLNRFIWKEVKRKIWSRRDSNPQTTG